MNVLLLERSRAGLDEILSLIRADGFAAESVTTNDDAVCRIESGRISAVVIGDGIHGDSRRRVRRAAREYNVAVVKGALGGRGDGGGVCKELLPALRAVATRRVRQGRRRSAVERVFP